MSKFRVLILFSLLFLTTSKRSKSLKEKIDSKNITNSKIYELNDSNFDLYVKEGKYYRWFITFYLTSCGHCKRARGEINKLFNETQENDTTRFAMVNVAQNPQLNIRFNSSGVPYIVLVQNGTMTELDKYAGTLANLKEFYLTDFKSLNKSEIKKFPKKIRFYMLGYYIVKEILASWTDGINSLLESKVKFIKFTPLITVLVILSLTAGIIYCQYKCCSYCCFNDENFEKELKEMIEKFEKQRKEEEEAEYEDGEDEEGEEIEDEEGEEIEDEEGDEEGEEIEDDEDQENGITNTDDVDKLVNKEDTDVQEKKDKKEQKIEDSKKKKEEKAQEKINKKTNKQDRVEKLQQEAKELNEMIKNKTYDPKHPQNNPNVKKKKE